MTTSIRSARKARTPEGISPSPARQFDKHLLVYALASTGMVGLTPPASAEIVYTPADVTLTNGRLDIDLNHDHSYDFFLSNAETQSYYLSGGAVDVGGAGSGTRAVLGRRRYGALAAPYGFPIGPDSPKPFFDVRNTALFMAWGIVSYNGNLFGGPWANAINRFLGFRFEVNGEIHYGWARLTVDVRRHGFPKVKAHLTGYAYESEPNKTILAGDRGFGPDASSDSGDPEDASLESNPALEPASLGRLSLGSVGLDSWRQQKEISHADDSGH
jgi:hypothetical protein